MDIALLSVCVACVALTRVGQMLFYCGVSRSKNATSAVARSLCDLAVTTLAFWGIGAAILLQGHNQYISLDWRLLFGENVAVLPYLALAIIASGQVTSAFSERSRFVVVWPVSLLMGLLIVPIVGHLVWAGLFKAHRAIDVGGAMPLHMASAVVALVAAWSVGPRTGKYNRDGSCNAIPGHNLVLMGAGLLVMAIGWLAYFALATWMWADLPIWRSVLSGLVAGAAGCCAAMLFSWFRYGKTDVTLTMLGLIAGMAGASAGVGLIPTWAAAVLGVIAGVVGPWFAIWMDVRWRIDDVSGLGSAIGAASVVSLVGSPLLAGGTVGQRFGSLGVNVIAMAATLVIAGGLAFGLFALLKRWVKLRASEADEYDGLDLAEHDVNAYPDFQQTMIKSHHLRQA